MSSTTVFTAGGKEHSATALVELHQKSTKQVAAHLPTRCPYRDPQMPKSHANGTGRAEDSNDSRGEGIQERAASLTWPLQL